MTQDQIEQRRDAAIAKLEKIKAKCLANLALAEKRTPGNWTCVFSSATEATVRDETGFIVATANQFAESFGDKRDDANAAYIAACAGAAEAGWKDTILQITWLLDDWQAADEDGDADCVRTLERRAETILADWEDSL